MEEAEIVTMESLCRVCLNHGENMTQMTRTQEEPENLQQSATISQLLERVMKIKIVEDEQWPSCICSTCLGILKVCKDFQDMFLNSQECLRQYFNQNVIINDDNNANGVDLIFGSNTFSLNDVVILEEQVEEMDYFERLVGNLNGAAVSLEMVNKGDVKLQSSVKSETVTSSGSESERGMPAVENWVFESNREMNESIEPPLAYQITIVTKDDINWNRSPCDLCPAAFPTKYKLMKHIVAQHCDHLRHDLCLDCAYAHAYNKIQVPELPSVPSDSCTKCGAFFQKRSCAGGKIRGKTDIPSSSVTALQEADHTTQMVELCAVCGESFGNLTFLVDHMMRTHGEKKKYKCSQCPKTSDSLAAHKRHSTIHTKSFRCSFCSKAFLSSGKKQEHELSHLEFRPFACGVCDKSFSSHCERQFHLKAKHQDVTYRKCQYCNSNFVEGAMAEALLKVHLKKVHGIEISTA